jgi:outer membrane immunogenic protein
MRKLLLSAIAVAAVSTSAFASDLPSTKNAPAFEIFPAFSWTGAYVGLDIGGARGGFGHAATSNGVVGGGYAGYNRQYGSFVFGVEGDVEGTSLGRTVQSLSFAQPVQGSVRARAGYAVFERTLAYVTGGLALADLKYDAPAFAHSDTRVGYTAGGGLEQALSSNLVARVEYRYTKYDGSKRLGADDHALRVGLAWKF